MNFTFNRHLILIGLAAGGLALGSLFADKPRYPQLEDPFGPRHGPPPHAQQDANRPPPPPPVESANQVDTSELIKELDSGADYDSESQATLEQLHALERFLDTPPEQLARIRESIERVEAMSDEEKQALKEKIRAFRNLNKDKVAKIRDANQQWQDISRDARRLVHRYVMSLPREEAIAIRQQSLAMTHNEAQAYFGELLVKAQAAEAAGTLPDLPESIRRWRHDREGDRSGRPAAPDQLNTGRKPRSDGQ